jgi:predicted amidophosphoribosyltransferase
VLGQTQYSVASVLTRTKETVPQVSLGRQQRLHNIKGIFQCDAELLVPFSGQTLILLDDVATTGATLNEARATLVPYLPADTKLICLALAH